MIDITPEQLKIVQSVLHETLQHGSRVWAYGSRTKGTSRPSSDLDLAIDDGRKLSLPALARIVDAFGEAPLPFKVDVLDLHDVSSNFRAVIDAQKIALPL
jgi:predicted nucleotidyltransferase